MESKVWYFGQHDTPAQAQQVYNTELLFGDKMRTFREICPGHLEATRSGKGGRHLLAASANATLRRTGRI